MDTPMDLAIGSQNPSTVIRLAIATRRANTGCLRQSIRFIRR
jgi:hypothetical protein